MEAVEKWVPALVGLVVFGCVLALVVQALERHEIVEGRPHRLLRLSPLLGLPGAVPAAAAVPAALLALGVAHVSPRGGLVLAGVLLLATGGGWLWHRRWVRAERQAP